MAAPVARRAAVMTAAFLAVTVSLVAAIGTWYGRRTWVNRVNLLDCLAVVVLATAAAAFVCTLVWAAGWLDVAIGFGLVACMLAVIWAVLRLLTRIDP